MQTPPAGFVVESMEVDGTEYHYAIYRPAGMAIGEPAAGLVFLHGYGECGTTGLKPIGVGLPHAIMFDPERWPFVVVIPQKPTHNSEWEDHEAAVLAILEHAVATQHIDPDRVAITGLSQGGHGTIQIASRNPDRFVAAAPVCGYVMRRFEDGERRGGAVPGPESDAYRAVVEGLRGVPIRLFHGGRDDVVPPTESTTLAKELEAAGADVEVTVFPDANHNSWDPTYRGSGVWSWLAEQTAE